MSLFFAHVYLLSLAWLLIAPVAMFVGTQPLRRQLFPKDHGSSVRHTKAHRWAMTLVFLMVTVGCLIGMFGLSHGPSKSLHGIVGIIIFALLCVLALFGMLRAYFVKALGQRNAIQQVLTPRKHLMTAIHRHMGIFVWTLAAINVLLGLLRIHAHYAHLCVVGVYSVLWFGVLTYQVYFKRTLANAFPPRRAATANDLNKLSNSQVEKVEETSAIPVV
ncbi:hypothetical protein BDF19DRAFT_184854 [Syncephalis fuscata]|nr:hypothetical protein BDF19DRAFT_184854 [Syncephalis fuscata]